MFALQAIEFCLQLLLHRLQFLIRCLCRGRRPPEEARPLVCTLLCLRLCLVQLLQGLLDINDLEQQVFLAAQEFPSLVEFRESLLISPFLGTPPGLQVGYLPLLGFPDILGINAEEVVPDLPSFFV